MTRRARHPVPKDIDVAIDEAGLRKDYELRPPYQQNDYVGWIARAATDVTRAKRIQQMLAELEVGGVYMGMKHGPSTKAGAATKKASAKKQSVAKKKTVRRS